MPALENVRHEAFCLHYAKTGNATESYKKAGYTTEKESVIYSNANRLLKNAKVQARLRELSDELKSEKIAGIVEIQERLTAILRSEELEQVVVVEGLGEGVSRARIIEKKPDQKNVIKAAETLAKMQGGFDSKVTLEMTMPVFGGEENLED